MAAQSDIIPAGSDWKYLDDGSEQGSAWRDVGFDDGGWASGPAQLGYGDGDEATVISYGGNSSNKHTTAYFRHAFGVADPGAVGALELSLVRDDGAVVYLNGVEVFRTNLPSGTIDSDTFALSAVGGADESAWHDTGVDAGLLVAGTNVIAVELHQVNLTSSDAGFDLRLSEVTPGVTRGPYLQMTGPDRATVRWRTNVPLPTELEFGTVEGALDQSASDATPKTEHEVTVTGLAPSTRYYYGIGDGVDVFAAGSGYFFDTHPVAGSEVPTRVWVLGDAGTANGNQAAVRDAFLAANGGDHTDVVLMLGDNAYDDGTDSEYQGAVFDMYPDTIRNSPVWPTLGNHDAVSANSADQSGVYYDIFTLPTNGESGGVPSGTEAYYSFDYANVHFICLDSHDTSRSATGAMAQWLESDLAATAQEWIIAFWHHPPYSKGGHDSDSTSDSGGRMVEMREVFVPIFEEYGVDLVFSGHTHNYQRSVLIDGHYGFSGSFDPGTMVVDGGDGDPAGDGGYTKTAQPHQGAVYTVAGSSGKVDGSAPSTPHPAMLRTMAELGSVVLDIDGTALHAQFIDRQGTVRDSFELVHTEPGPNQAPVLANNAITVTEGQPVVVGSAELSAHDPDGADGALLFTVSDVLAGEFLVGGVAGTSFTQAQVGNGDIVFVHDGSAVPPGYSVTVSDGDLSDGPHAATVTFSVIDDLPVLTSNYLQISDGEVVPVDATVLAASDDETESGALVFSVTGLSGGEFRLSGSPAGSFSQADVTAGEVTFHHDGGGAPPAYDVAVSDGGQSSGAQTAVVRFEGGDVDFIPIGAVWSYMDDGSDQGTVWSGTFFDDRAWAAGAAQLGYGDGDETTVISYGGNSSNKHRTTYFRKSFAIPNPLAFESLALDLVRDDGAVVYLNGTEVFRSNMPGGAVDYLTFASSAVGGGSESALNPAAVSPGLLRAGTNVVAVELHQANATSSDTSFDFRLRAVPSAVNLPPALGNNALTVTEGVAVVLGVGDLSAGDPDDPAGSLVFTVSAVTGGEFLVGGVPASSFLQAEVTAGDVTFVPDGSEVAPAYDVSVTDGVSVVGPSPAAVAFTAVNDPPVIVANGFAVGEGATVTLSAADIAATDEESDDAVLVATPSSVVAGEFLLDAAPANSFTIGDVAAGRVSFAHDGSQAAPSYDLVVADGAGGSAGPSAGSVTFVPVDDPPVLLANGVVLAEGGVVVLGAAEIAASDEETAAGDLVFTVSGVSGATFTVGRVPSVSFSQSEVASGFVALSHDGSESAPAYSVSVSDGAQSTPPSPAAVTFTPLNDPPVITANSLAVAEGAEVVLGPGDLAATDEESDDAALVFTVSGVVAGEFRVGGVPGGVFSQAEVAAGQVSFLHDGSETAPGYSVEVSDGVVTAGPFAASVVFTPVNDPPTLGASALVLSEGEVVVLGSGFTDAADEETAADGLAFAVTGVTGGEFRLGGAPASGFSGADLAAGQVSFAHDGSEAAPAYSVTVTDAGGLTAGPVAGAVTFTPLNDPPVITANSLAVSEGAEVVLGPGDLAATDEESDDAALVFTVSGVVAGEFRVGGVPGGSFSQAEVATGQVSFAHDGSAVPPAYQVSVTDGTDTTGPEAASIAFAADNDPPVILVNALTVAEGELLLISPAALAATDEDSDEGALVFTVELVSFGTFELNGTPAVSFTQDDVTTGLVAFRHDGSENAPAITVSVSDGFDASPLSATAVTFTPLNDAPEITANSLGVAEGAEVVLGPGDLAAADEESDDAALEFTVSGVVAGEFRVGGVPGSVFSQAEVVAGQVSFAHDGSETAPAYSVEVSDGVDSSGPAIASVVFTPVNDPPTLSASALVLSEGDVVVLGSGFTDAADEETAADGLAFAVTGVTGGEFRLGGAPASGFSGADLIAGQVSFAQDGSEAAPVYSVTVTDAGGLTAGPVAGAVTFTPLNDPPVITANSLAVAEGAEVVLGPGDLAAADEESDDATLEFTVSGVVAGEFRVGGVPGVVFSQAEVSAGQVSFAHDGSETAPGYSVEVSDGTVTAGPGPAVVAFSPVNDPPEITAGAFAVDEGATVVLAEADLAASDPDSDDGSLVFTVDSVTSGEFELAGVPSLSFTQDDVTSGLVAFAQDGTEVPPTATVSVSDGEDASVPAALAIAFTPLNDSPEITANALAVAEGAEVVLGPGDLAAADEESDDAALEFTVSGVVAGEFRVGGVPGGVFTQAEVAAGLVSFAHDGSDTAPAYSVEVSDGTVTVGPEAAAVTFTPVNDPPTVDAGGDQTVPVTAGAALSGSASDDGQPAPPVLVILWTQDSGPGTASFSDAGAAVTSVAFSEPGVYSLRLTADDGELNASDSVVITAEAVNVAPAVDAGPDLDVTLPGGAALAGAASDDGLPAGSSLAATWSAVSGPGVVTFGDASSPATSATFSAEGTYVLRLEATDSELVSSDDVTVTVSPPNQAPTVDAGGDQAGSVALWFNLDATVSDDGLPSGSTLTTAWSQVSGPGAATFLDATLVDTAVAFDLEGDYVLRLTADDSELTASDDIAITALPAEIGFEAGVVDGVSDSWEPVVLSRSYVSPVVVCSINYGAGDSPAVARVRGAAGSQFELKVQSPSNDPVSGYSVHYFVVEEGVYNEADDGIKMEAIRFTSTVTDRRGSWAAELRSYLNSYTNPVVLGQVMTEADPDWSVFWAAGANIKNPPESSTLRVGKNVSEDSDTTRADEVVGYVVFEAGTGVIDGIPYEAAVGARSVRGFTNGPPFTYSLPDLAGATAVAVSTAGMRGNNGGWPALYGADPLTPTSLDLVFDEDQVRDNERSHTTERVAYIVFESPPDP